MENAEKIFHLLEDFSKCKSKVIPQELNEYLAYVARTGDPVYQWSLVKSLFKEKLLSVITDFHETAPGIGNPPYINVDRFNYDIMKNSLIERLDSFTSTPFTVQKISELLIFPRKHYNRVDKFMRAIEKNILVVSTREPGIQSQAEPENGEPVENGSDNNSEYNVAVEMEDMSWKENAEQPQISEPQPGSSDTHISADDIEARLTAKRETNQTPEEIKASAEPSPQATVSKFIIPELIIEDAEMTEQRLLAQSLQSNQSDTPSEESCNKESEPTPETTPEQPKSLTIEILLLKIALVKSLNQHLKLLLNSRNLFNSPEIIIEDALSLEEQTKQILLLKKAVIKDLNQHLKLLQNGLKYNPITTQYLMLILNYLQKVLRFKRCLKKKKRNLIKIWKKLSLIIRNKES